MYHGEIRRMRKHLYYYNYDCIFDSVTTPNWWTDVIVSGSDWYNRTARVICMFQLRRETGHCSRRTTAHVFLLRSFGFRYLPFWVSTAVLEYSNECWLRLQTLLAFSINMKSPVPIVDSTWRNYSFTLSPCDGTCFVYISYPSPYCRIFSQYWILNDSGPQVSTQSSLALLQNR